MKKLLFGAAALLFSGALMAQSNNSTSTQSGDDQRIYVRQAGIGLTSAIDQANGSGSGANLAKIWQRGADNSSDVSQIGTNNQASVLQGITWPAPNDNSVTVDQGTNNAGSANNKAYVEQHGGNNSATTVTQDGTANEAYAHQDGVMGVVDITQDGDSNASAVWQNFGDYTAANNTATMNQTGTGNNSYAVQNGDGNTLASTQGGMNNKSDQNQNSNGAASGNNATVDQEGSGNKALQIQVGGGNTATVDQTNYDGPPTDNYAEQNQNGNGNTAILDQEGVSDYGRQDQTGNNNSATGHQWYNSSSNNKLYQRQNGNGNIVHSDQYFGDNNLTSTYQSGNGNNGYTQQTGGDDNQILLVQKTQGGLSHVASVIQNGNLNMADVLQLGPGGDFTTDGEQCDFQTPATLNCPDPITPISIAAPCTPGAPGC